MFALQVLNVHIHMVNVITVNDSVYKVFFKKQTKIELCVLAAGVHFPSECVEEVQRQRQLLWDAAAFLLSNQIPAVVSPLWSNNVHIYHVHEVSDDIFNSAAAPVCVCVW